MLIMMFDGLTPTLYTAELDWQPSVERSSIKGERTATTAIESSGGDARMGASMVLQALDKMPGGSETYHEPGDPKILAKAPSRAPEGTYEAITSKIVEAIRCSTSRVEVKVEERCLIASQSVLQMFITIPYAAKCMIGYKVADIPAIAGSFDPCIGETDR